MCRIIQIVLIVLVYLLFQSRAGQQEPQ